ncbi:hypothetical protein K9M79_03045 [Candidatus Woesearchaeota archaeon]|nr:hypothetical protein [Candidatus Woesearchaeota archaeon]
MTNVNAAGSRASPLGGAGLDGTRIVYVTAAKAAQDDTVTITNCNAVLCAQVMIADGSSDWAVDTFTIDVTTTNMINLTGATTGTVHIMALVK